MDFDIEFAKLGWRSFGGRLRQELRLATRKISRCTGLNRVQVSLMIAKHSKNKTPFWGLLYLGVKPKRGWYVFRLFFKVGLCSAISFKRSRRELSIDVAELLSMLKNFQNMHYSRFSSIPKTGKALPKMGDLFLL